MSNQEISIDTISISPLSISDQYIKDSFNFSTNYTLNENNIDSSGIEINLDPSNSPHLNQMNSLAFSELFFLFCCPPCPGTIAAKLAFLPPEPTYTFSSVSLTDSVSSNISSTFLSCISTNNSSNIPNNASQNYIEASLSLTRKAEWQHSLKELKKIEVCWSKTSRNNKIACMYVKAVPEPKFVILFSHGNAIDIGQMSSYYLSLGTRLNCNVFSYDYSGYGVSTGKPSEKNMYADIECAWHTLRNKYGYSPEKIILYGQSIGTVPTVDLASKYEVAAVILHSPLMSGMRVAFPQTKRTWFFDPFPTIDKITKVSSSVLIIHGTNDEVIDISHGQAIYERCPKSVEPLWVDGAGHNDVESFPQYLKRLRQFITVDLAN